ncbi:MAG TPA: hypothetical protein VK308_11965, partial [Pyrinomonadaceae bacterium]|nr:hypothetical protein [Pyrinomonadaceae bacterium]
CDSEHPSDATLEENFYKYEADLNLLAQMAIEDAAMIRVAPEFTWHKDNADGKASKAALGFSDERYDEYKKIFRRIGKNNGILNYQPDQMLVLVSSRGLVTGGSSKGYAYLPKEPTELRESLDNVSFKDSEKRIKIAYKRLRGNWYLFYQVS